jgi:hypothetical protein
MCPLCSAARIDALLAELAQVNTILNSVTVERGRAEAHARELEQDAARLRESLGRAGRALLSVREFVDGKIWPSELIDRVNAAIDLARKEEER